MNIAKKCRRVLGWVAITEYFSRKTFYVKRFSVGADQMVARSGATGVVFETPITNS